MTPKSRAMAIVAEEGAVDANVLRSSIHQHNSQRRTDLRKSCEDETYTLIVSSDTRAVMIHLYRFDQF